MLPVLAPTGASEIKSGEYDIDSMGTNIIMGEKVSKSLSANPKKYFYHGQGTFYLEQRTGETI